MNYKVKQHYARLLKDLRVEGLWAWGQMGQAMLTGGLSLQTGTVAVERLWASCLDMLPRSSRLMSVSWFTLLANIIFLRHTYRHFNHNLMPWWSERNALFAERLESMAFLVKAFQDDAAPGEGSESSSLFDPFL